MVCVGFDVASLGVVNTPNILNGPVHEARLCVYVSLDEFKIFEV